MKSIVYSPEVLTFVQSAVELCSLLERFQETTFSDRTAVLLLFRQRLSTLYLTTLSLPHIDLDPFGYNEQVVTEDRYNEIRLSLSSFFAEDDTFLETEHHDMQYSDTPIAVTLSEYLSDLYQVLMDMAWSFKEQNESAMSQSIADIKETFEEEWGIKLLNALRQIHTLCGRAVSGGLSSLESEELSSPDHTDCDCHHHHDHL